MKTQPKNHVQTIHQPLSQSTVEEFSNDDFCLYDHIKEDGFLPRKSVVRYIIIILCIKGMIKYEHNDKTMCAKVGDLIIFNSEQKIANQQSYFDFEGTMLMISEQMLPLLPYQRMSYQTLKRRLEAHPVISLRQEDLESIKLNLQLLSLYTNKHYNEETVLKTTQLLFNEFILSQEGTNLEDGTKDKSSHLTIANRFAELVADNTNKRINVTWCCKKLNYSSTKLVQAVKEYFQVTPHEYIKLKKLDISFTLLKSKLSVHEISERLTFSSVSTFCRTFKKYTKTTPRQFHQLTTDQQDDITRHTIPYQIFP